MRRLIRDSSPRPASTPNAGAMARALKTGLAQALVADPAEEVLHLICSGGFCA